MPIKRVKTPKVKGVSKKRITNLIVIDASSSMNNKIEEVKGGLRQLFTQIKTDAIKDKTKVITRTIVLDFSSFGDVNILVDSEDSSLLTESLANGYTTRGMTALFDAIGRGFNMIKGDQTGVFINIITDGQENDSKEMTAEAVKKLIEEGKSKKWGITFMGTTEAAISTATSWGISAGNTLKFADTKEGMNKSLAKMRSVRSTYYMSSTLGEKIDLDNMMNKDEE